MIRKLDLASIFNMIGVHFYCPKCRVMLGQELHLGPVIICKSCNAALEIDKKKWMVVFAVNYILVIMLGQFGIPLALLVNLLVIWLALQKISLLEKPRV